MSHVTNIMISCPLLIENKIEGFLKEFTKETMPFLNISDCKVGGDKNLEATLFIAAFNYLNYSEFIEFMHSLEFKLGEMSYGSIPSNYDMIQVFIRGQDDELWSVYFAPDLEISCFVH